MENLILLAAVINRLVELFKQALPADNPALEKWRGVILLALSFVLGSVAMVAVFPDQNLFPGASSPLAGLIFSGILVGGVANGYDWLGTIVEQRTTNRFTSLSTSFEARGVNEATSTK